MRSREPDIVAATLTLDDAKPLYLELKETGLSFHQALRSEPWGARTFIVRDPDENLILFAGRSGQFRKTVFHPIEPILDGQTVHPLAEARTRCAGWARVMSAE